MPKKLELGPCGVIGCGRPIESIGLCGKHYRMQRLYGRTEKKNRGNKRSHALYVTWFERKERGSLCPEWAADFWAFVGVIEPRPSPDHRLRRIRPHESYGPSNWTWEEVLRRGADEPAERFHARKWQRRKQKHPDFERRRHLIRKFGLTPEQYDELLKAQGGVCAICRKPETGRHSSTGEIKSLAVDHDHATGQVRDLLCFSCNGVLGKVGESIATLEAMVHYLRRWADENHPGLARPPAEFSASREIMLETEWGTLNASEAARRAGLDVSTVLSRLRSGWPPHSVLQPLKRPRRRPPS